MTLPIWQSFITDSRGNALPKAEITVYEAGTSTIAAIYSDKDGNNSLNNPFESDSAGLATFFAYTGLYDIEAKKDGKTAKFKRQLLSSPSTVAGGEVITATEDSPNVYSGDSSQPLEDKRIDVWNFTSPNTSKRPTLEDGGQGAKTLKALDGGLWEGALAGIHFVAYDSSNDVYRVLNPHTSPILNPYVASGRDAYTFDAARDIPDGDVVLVDIPIYNTTASATLENIGGSPSGAKTLRRWDGQALVTYDLDGVHRVQWDQGGDQWLVLDPHFTVGTIHHARSGLIQTNTVGGKPPITVSDDGTRVYQYNTNNTEIEEYTLSTAGDPASASKTGGLDVSPDISGDVFGLFLRPDGTSIYVLDETSGDDEILRYVMSTAKDIGTASFDSRATVDGGNARDLHFRPDGTAFFYLEDQTNLSKYTLSTAWDITTLTKDQQVDIGNKISTDGADSDDVKSVTFSDDGTIALFTAWVAGVFKYERLYRTNLSTAWSLSSLSYTQGDFADLFTDQIVTIDARSSPMELYLGWEDNGVVKMSFSEPWNVRSAYFLPHEPILRVYDTTGNFAFDVQARNLGSNQGRLWIGETLNAQVLETRDASGLAGNGLSGDGDLPAEKLQFNPTDIAGEGLESDGATPPNLRIAATAAGNGLTGGSGSALAVATDGIQTNEIDLSIVPTWTSKHTFSSGIDVGSSLITSVADGSNDTDAVNKRQLDDVNQGRTRKQAAKAAATGDVDLSSSTDPNPIDGYTLSDGDRVLLPNQGTGTENGIYDAVTATDPTTWVRSSDADEDEEVKAGISLVILNGTQNADKEAVQDTENPTLGTDTLTFSLYSLSSVSAGTGLSKTGNTLDLTINGLSSLGAAPDAADKLAVYDDSAGSHVEISMSELESFITDGVSVTGTQWGYLGGLDQPLSSSDSPDFGGFTISSTQWGYVGGLGSAPAETGASNTFTALQTVNNAEGTANGYKIQGTSAGAIDFRWLQKSTTTFEFTDETNAVEIAQYDQSTGNWDFRSANPMNNGNDLLDTTDLSANGGNVVTDDRTNTFVGVQRIERSNFPGIEHRDTAGNTGDANDMFFSGMDDKGNYVIRSMDASSGAHESIVKVDFAAPNDSLVIDQNGNFGIGTSSPSSKLDIGLATEDAAVVDAGSSGATQQDWIEVTVGGNTGYLRVYASK